MVRLKLGKSRAESNMATVYCCAIGKPKTISVFDTDGGYVS